MTKCLINNKNCYNLNVETVEKSLPRSHPFIRLQLFPLNQKLDWDHRGRWQDENRI
jgi:hypothetical protein